MHCIIKNTMRYGKDLDRKIPNFILCNGTLEQAEELADRLTNWNAGCDFAYYIVGTEDNQ